MRLIKALLIAAFLTTNAYADQIISPPGAAGSGDITDVYNCASGDCSSITVTDGDLLNFSGVNASSTTEGIILPQASGVTAASAEGQISWDSTKDYGVIGTAGSQQVTFGSQWSIVPAGDFTLQTAAGVQSAFPTTGDVWTLPASTTFYFQGHYHITKTTGSITTALAFAFSNAPTSIRYHVIAHNGAANSTIAVQGTVEVDQAASTVTNVAATTAYTCYFNGIIRTNAATTITPQINFSGTATVPVMKAGSYIKFEAIGTSTTNTIGNVA